MDYPQLPICMNSSLKGVSQNTTEKRPYLIETLILALTLWTDTEYFKSMLENLKMR